MNNESVKKGLWVFGVVLACLGLGGLIWSVCSPDADKPLTPVEKQELQQIQDQEPHLGVALDASVVSDATVDAG